MSKSYKEKVSEKKSKSDEGSGQGHLDVRFNSEDDTKRFDVSRVEYRSGRYIVDFAMFEGGDGTPNRFIEVAVNENFFSQRIEFPNASRADFLFQSATEEWRPAKGWVRAEWNPASKTLEGLLGDVESDRPENTKLTWGKFQVIFN